MIRSISYTLLESKSIYCPVPELMSQVSGLSKLIAILIALPRFMAQKLKSCAIARSAIKQTLGRLRQLKLDIVKVCCDEESSIKKIEQLEWSQELKAAFRESPPGLLVHDREFAIESQLIDGKDEVIIYEDNEAAIHLAKSGKSNSDRAKRIALRRFLLNNVWMMEHLTSFIAQQKT